MEDNGNPVIHKAQQRSAKQVVLSPLSVAIT